MDYTTKDIKQYLKQIAIEIRILKILRKMEKNQKGLNKYNPDLVKELKKTTFINSNIFSLKRKFRHFHIAYCMFRGKTIDQIERNSKTSVDFIEIDRILKKIKKAMENVDNEKNVCVG